MGKLGSSLSCGFQWKEQVKQGEMTWAALNDYIRLWQSGYPQLSGTRGLGQVDSGPECVNPIKEGVGGCGLWVAWFALGSALVSELIIISRKWLAQSSRVSKTSE